MPWRFYTRGKSKTWQVEGSEVTPWGTVIIRRSTGKNSRGAAEKWLREKVHVETEMLRSPRSQSATINTVAAHYIDHLVDKQTERRKHVPGWVSPDLEYLKPIVARFGDRKVADLTPEDVASFEREHYGHKVPDTRRRELYTPLNAMIARCGPDGLKICPYVRFKPPESGRRMVVDYADRAWLLQLADDRNQRLVTAVFFLASTGARVTEMCRIKRTAVDWTTGDVTLRITKNGAPRLVSVAPALLEMMRRGLVEGDDRVFGYESRWSVNQALERACARREIRYLSSHKCGRHAFAAMMLGNKQTLQAVMVAGGWSGIRVVSESYGHLERGVAQTAQVEIGASLAGHTNGTHPAITSAVVSRQFQEKAPENPGLKVVGATGIEPVTPTMSRLMSPLISFNEKPDG